MGRLVNEMTRKTLLPLATHSWFLGANDPGKLRVFMHYAGGIIRYRDIGSDIAAGGMKVSRCPDSQHRSRHKVW